MHVEQHSHLRHEITNWNVNDRWVVEDLDMIRNCGVNEISIYLSTLRDSFEADEKTHRSGGIQVLDVGLHLGMRTDEIGDILVLNSAGLRRQGGWNLRHVLTLCLAKHWYHRKTDTTARCTALSTVETIRSSGK